jgi:hypothetical protein
MKTSELQRVAWGMIAAAGVATALAEPPTTSEQRAAAAKARVAKLKAKVVVDGNERAIEFSDKPIFTFTDPTRVESEGTVWIVGTKGRPKAILSLFFEGNSKHWIYEFTSLGPQTVSVAKESRWEWRTSENGLTSADLDGQPPAESSAARLQQMKAYAREFSGDETFFDGQRAELRLLAQPIHRYQDAAAGVLDAAVFSFAHGTNPEILLFVEALKAESNSRGRWRYGVARMSSAEVRLRRGKDEVWSRAANTRGSAPTSSYYSQHDMDE